MRRREVQGTPFSHPVPAVRVTGGEQPLLERAAGEAVSLQGNDLVCVCSHPESGREGAKEKNPETLSQKMVIQSEESVEC